MASVLTAVAPRWDRSSGYLRRAASRCFISSRAATAFNPYAHLVKAPDGSLYGTTVTGGNGRGTVFKIASDGSFVPVYAFADNGMDQTDGMSPSGSLAIDPDGTVYGVTSAGGANNGGTLFKIVNGSFSVVYAFGAAAPGTGQPTGSAPMGGLAWGADGRLYGTTTAGGGEEQRGTIFSYDPRHRHGH